MILDKELLVSNSQGITASAASTNYIDLGGSSRDIGAGEPLAMAVFVDGTADSAGDSATLTIAIQQDDNTLFSDPTTLLQTQAYTQASLTSGRDPIVIPVPEGMISEQYLRLYYTVGSENFSGSSLSLVAGVVHGVQSNN